MTNKEIISYYGKTLDELEDIYSKVKKDNKLNLSDDNIYLAISFVSKIIGLNSIFTDEFIEEYNIKPMVNLIDKKSLMIQASHYSDKNLFYEFFEVVYSQLKYRYNQILKYEKMSKEERKLLLITIEYHMYLYNSLKDYLDTDSEGKFVKQILEIMSIINLYKIVKDDDIVCLGSKITYMDSVDNEVKVARIVLPSHANGINKLSLNKYRLLISHKKNDVVYLDYSTSYFIRILDIDNKMDY